MKLLIIRHGDPDYEHDTLTERGWKEAELLADRLIQQEKITKIYCSPLGRAKDTAKPYCDKTGMSYVVLDWLREFPRPMLQPLKELGLSDEDARSCPWDMRPEVFNAYASQLTDVQHWSELLIYTTFEADKQAQLVKDNLFGLLAQHGLIHDGYFYQVDSNHSWDEMNNETIAIFCHMGLGSLLMANLAHVAPPLYWQMVRVMPTSVSNVLFQKTHSGLVQSKIFMIGDTSHLMPIGLTYRG